MDHYEVLSFNTKYFEVWQQRAL